MNKKNGPSEWFINPEEQKNIKEKLSTIKDIGKEDDLAEEKRIHEIKNTGSKEGKELVDDEFTIEGKISEEKAKSVLKNIDLEFKKIHFELSQNNIKLTNMIESEQRLFERNRSFIEKMEEEKNPVMRDTLKLLSDQTMDMLETVEKAHNETKKIIVQREDELEVLKNRLIKKYNNIEKIMNPVNPEKN